MKKSVDPIVNLYLQLLLKDYFNRIPPPYFPITNQFAIPIHPMHLLLLNKAYQKYSLLFLESVPGSSAFHKNYPLLMPLCFLPFLPSFQAYPILQNHNYCLLIL